MALRPAIFRADMTSAQLLVEPGTCKTVKTAYPLEAAPAAAASPRKKQLAEASPNLGLLTLFAAPSLGRRGLLVIFFRR
jgi:hypothetical protein